jgi:hypothetical protein
MSITPRNIVLDGPDVMSAVLAIGINPISSSGEGSPIYETIDAEAAVSGTYTDGPLEYDFSSTTAIPQQYRAELRPLVGGVDVAGEHYEIERDHDVSSWVDFGFISVGDPSTFLALQSNILGCNGGSPPFAPPFFYVGTDLTDYSIEGTVTDTSEDPETVNPRGIELIFTPPFFRGSIQDGDLEMVVSLTATVNVEDPGEYTETFEFITDASAWDTTDFRDIRGTYGTTSYDANGIQYIWSITLG